LVTLRNWGFPAYSILKKVSNIDPNWALESFGSGRYMRMQRMVSALAYWMSWLSMPHSPWGVELVAVFERE
jgi:hypothetical protein